tara:strand:- start:59480 stop:59878 length:399 start_codon:yes stop_codon:yes gene_type:complete
MKILVMLSLLTSFLFAAEMSEKSPEEIAGVTGIPICAIVQSQILKDDIIALGKNDKFMHCALSCQIALRCGGYESLSIGILKELWDLVTPGDADIKDIEADLRGIRLATRRQANNDYECINRCDLIYQGDKK